MANYKIRYIDRLINRLIVLSVFACAGGCSSADSFVPSSFVPEEGEGAQRGLVEEGEISAGDSVSSDRFGYRIAASNTTALVGNYNQVSSAVYALTYDGSAWVDEAKLLPDEGAVGEGFGISIAVSEDTALVGSYLDSVGGKSVGAAYVFVRENRLWIKQAKLIASDGAPFDLFGSAVALSGDTAVIGAFQGNGKAGASYVFTRTGGVWTEQGKLVADDASPGDNFGISVAVSGDAVVVGADAKSDGAMAGGAAYVFRRTSGVWTQEAVLKPSDGSELGFFGNVGALSGDTILAGSYISDSLGPGSTSGAVYAFARVEGHWVEQAKIIPGDLSDGDGFGVAVHLSKDAAVIGSFHDDAHGATSGSAYLFARCGDVWSERAKLSPDTLSAGDEFGRAVALTGDKLLVGAPNDDAAGPNSGSVFTFTAPPILCPNSGLTALTAQAPRDRPPPADLSIKEVHEPYGRKTTSHRGVERGR